MEKSSSIKAIASALIKFQIRVDKVSKDSNNPFFKSTYASLSHIQETIKGHLSECGLVYSQFPDGEDNLTTLLIHAESGEYFQSTNKMKPVKDDPQSLGSAITYNKRYALASILALNIDDDDDGNKASQAKPNDKKRVEAPKAKQSLNDELFSQVIERVRKGELSVYQKTHETYNLTEPQKKILDHQYQLQNISEETFEQWQTEIGKIKSLEELKKFKTKNSPFVVENTRVAKLITDKLQSLSKLVTA